METRQIKFTKLEGLGNDFVLIDGLTEPGWEEFPTDQLADLAVKLCDRHFGIGADGILLLLKSAKANFLVRIFNPDGSEAGICGNGLRCVVRYLWDKKLISEDLISIETLSGIKLPAVIVEDGWLKAIEVDMEEPGLLRKEIPMTGPPEEKFINQPIEACGCQFQATCVSMGNPHCVIFVPDVEAIDLETLGPALENHPLFPERTNVEFVQVVDRKNIIIRVWERGAGITMACGSGTCASVVAASLNDLTDRAVIADLPGGRLLIEWDSDDNHVVMTGPAEKVFEGVVEI